MTKKEIKDDKNQRCPVGGVDRTQKVDKISLQNAVETPFWMAVWAAEPGREIEVRMSYDDLKIICDLIDGKRKDRWIPVEKKIPEDGTYLCTFKGELCGIEEPFTGMCGIENGMWDEPDCVIAWKPMPDPYQPKGEKKC